jgi:hypothetical protein
MYRLKKRFLALTGLALMLLSFTPAVHAISFDIQGHWAEGAIKEMTEAKILNGYPDGSFKPDQSITRAEFAKVIAKAYNFKSKSTPNFTDVKSHWAKEYIAALTEKKLINGYPDGNFQPDRPISRAEMVTVLSRLVNLGTEDEKYTSDLDSSFPDISTDFWAFKNIEIASRLGILPGYYKPEFRPSRLASRADTAWMVNTLRNMEIIEGKVMDDGNISGTLIIQTNHDDPETVVLSSSAIVFRNNLSTTPDKIQQNDQIKVYKSTSGEYSVAKAVGEVTKDDLLGRLSSGTKGKVSPEQVSAILSGDWDSVKENIQGDLYNRMLAFGLNPSEAESVLAQDWEYLDSLSKDRLSEALSGATGITKDLSRALLDRDMDRIKEYSKIELTTAALTKIMQSGVLGSGDSVDS